ncbi:unnamed protein product [Leptosia nina]|uniref:Centrosomal and chromosomal factor n=1 Tax=Leptosia nina TaxID=320188 RepID=A0AAV1JWS6_9NEOP
MCSLSERIQAPSEAHVRRCEAYSFTPLTIGTGPFTGGDGKLDGDYDYDTVTAPFGVVLSASTPTVTEKSQGKVALVFRAMDNDVFATHSQRRDTSHGANIPTTSMAAARPHYHTIIVRSLSTVTRRHLGSYFYSTIQIQDRNSFSLSFEREILDGGRYLAFRRRPSRSPSMPILTTRITLPLSTYKNGRKPVGDSIMRRCAVAQTRAAAIFIERALPCPRAPRRRPSSRLRLPVAPGASDRSATRPRQRRDLQSAGRGEPGTAQARLPLSQSSARRRSVRTFARFPSQDQLIGARRTCREAAPATMTGYARGEADFAADRFRRDARPASLAPKDYSVPLHVDCSIEYELPDCAKPPQGVKIEPLLMIHPSHFRRLESLRRVPFVNNLPRTEGGGPSATGAAPSAPDARRGGRAARRCCRAVPAAPAPPPQPQPRLPEDARRYRLEYVAEAGKLARGRLKAHPYLPPEALDCDIRALPPPAHYERFDKRALHQLPIYM